MTSTITNKKQILIVEDEESVSQMLAMLLETRGFEVKTAASGEEALQKAAEHANLDLILLDLILPDVEGFEVCRRLKEKKATQHIPIIIVSSRYLYENKVEGLYLGADDYLTKPFDYEELFARMEAVMRRGIFADGKDEFNTQPIILELRKIIDDELIVPFYQPIYLLKEKKIMGLEILSRPRTESVLSNPELLFRAALKFGLYSDLETLAWRKALKNMPADISRVKLFFNCNPYLVEGPKFTEVQSIFKEFNVLADNVVLELTERSAIAEFKAFYQCLKQYRQYGFKMAVDDVGGGYASLEAIVEIHPEVVKIDRHIVNGLSKDSFKKSIVKFIVSFCRENNIISIAEGIETKEDLRTVRDLGITAGQGYYLCRPTPQINFKAMTAHLSSIM